jgi:hypothetical protein
VRELRGDQRVRLGVGAAIHSGNVVYSVC